MNSYRIKEILWAVIAVGFLLLAVMGNSHAAEQVCDLKTKTVSVTRIDGTVETSKVEVMECNDNSIQRLFQVQSGMAPNCGEFMYWMRQGGQDVQRKGVSCQKPNGSWEIVNTAGR
jgi:hypothetical protein